MAEKNLVIIPLRANSIRLPNKNTMELDGIPLFLHSINYAKENAEFINEIVVITNDDKVKEIAKEHKITINENKGSSNLNIITDRLSYKRSLELTKEADVSLIIEADSNISPFMPGKLADLIFLEKPILALTPKKSETLRILGEYYPFSARVNDDEEIFIKLLKLWNLWKGQKLVLLEKDRLMNYVSPKRINDELENLFKKS